MTRSSKTYVLDTSVVLSDPGAMRAFQEHEVVVPLTTIAELEAKRHHPELGWAARQALRLLESLRVEHGRLDRPIPVTAEGGTLRVEMNHRDLSSLPLGLQTESGDHRILAVAANLAADGHDVALVSKDLPLAAEGVGRRASRRRNTAASLRPTAAGPAPPRWTCRPRCSTGCTQTASSTSTRRATCPATRGWC